MKESIYNQILKIVCDYFGVSIVDVMTNRTQTRDAHNVARGVATFFMREYTNDSFWYIGRFFGESRKFPEARYYRVAKRVFSEDDKHRHYKGQLADIQCRLQKIIW
jgi:hypothetical protein